MYIDVLEERSKWKKAIFKEIISWYIFIVDERQILMIVKFLHNI